MPARRPLPTVWPVWPAAAATPPAARSTSGGRHGLADELVAAIGDVEIATGVDGDVARDEQLRLQAGPVGKTRFAAAEQRGDHARPGDGAGAVRRDSADLVVQLVDDQHGAVGREDEVGGDT